LYIQVGALHDRDGGARLMRSEARRNRYAVCPFRPAST
jgi:hypothetical protein